MANLRNAGFLGSSAGQPWGISGVPYGYTASTTYAVVGHDNDRQCFEPAFCILQAQIANLGITASLDSSTRAQYDRLLRQFRQEVERQVAAGRMSWPQAAEQARAACDQIIKITQPMFRVRGTTASHPLTAEQKLVNPSLNTLIAQKTLQQHGQSARFDRLSDAQKTRYMRQ